MPVDIVCLWQNSWHRSVGCVVHLTLAFLRCGLFHHLFYDVLLSGICEQETWEVEVIIANNSFFQMCC